MHKQTHDERAYEDQPVHGDLESPRPEGAHLCCAGTPAQPAAAADDDLPLVPPYAEEAMAHGYRPRYQVLNEPQRRAFHALVEQAFGVVKRAMIPGVSRDDAYIAWCALRRDFPEVYWVQSARILAGPEGAAAVFDFDEPIARRGRPYVLLDYSLQMALVECALVQLACALEDEASGDTPAPPDPAVLVRHIYQRLARSPLLHEGSAPSNYPTDPPARDFVLSEQAALDLKCLCDRCDIDSQVVVGSWHGLPHSWNVVRVGDQWLHVDAFAGRKLLGEQEVAGRGPCDAGLYLLRVNDDMRHLAYDWKLAGLLPYL